MGFANLSLPLPLGFALRMYVAKLIPVAHHVLLPNDMRTIMSSLLLQSSTVHDARARTHICKCSSSSVQREGEQIHNYGLAFSLSLSQGCTLVLSQSSLSRSVPCVFYLIDRSLSPARLYLYTSSAVSVRCRTVGSTICVLLPVLRNNDQRRSSLDDETDAGMTAIVKQKRSRATDIKHVSTSGWCW